LREAGGRCDRTALSKAVRPWTAAADFDEALTALAARGEITGESVTAATAAGGTLSFRPAIVYWLAPDGRRKPSKLPTPRNVGKYRRNPVPTGVELDERVFDLLAEAGGSMDRGKPASMLAHSW
jgi:hypothetical protein